MKVLFAVNSESVSEAIIKKYQKDYREILSYKNVYYFNAIIKEIQKDKSYDRIVISEDLEPFSSSNYESIDKFVFEKLDGISDDAHDGQGKEISIILICSDRHTKGSSFLVKIFGIGVYNALLGNDRSMEEVCRLIHKPRTKKEAKLYYKIDTDDVNYRAESENEVSELEIQNILSHFKKLGRNTDRYAGSFEKIAMQYTNEQLKIIINCLPIAVKAVLEETSNKYQEIMSINGELIKGVRNSTIEAKRDQKRTGVKIDIIENKKPVASGPIVIPNSVKPTGSVAKKIDEPKEIEEHMDKKPVVQVSKKEGIEQVETVEKLETIVEIPEEQDIKIVKPEPKRRGRPRKNPIDTSLMPEKPKGKRGRPRKEKAVNLAEEINKVEEINKMDDLDNLKKMENDELPDLELITEKPSMFNTDFSDDTIEEIDPVETSKNTSEVELPELDDLDDIDTSDIFDDDDFLGVTEEAFDEFDDYDEYGEYETKSKSVSVEKLYNEDILEETTQNPVEDDEDDEDDDLDSFDMSSFEELDDLDEVDDIALDNSVEEKQQNIEINDDLDSFDMSSFDELDELDELEDFEDIDDFEEIEEIEDFEEVQEPEPQKTMEDLQTEPQDEEDDSNLLLDFENNDDLLSELDNIDNEETGEESFNMEDSFEETTQIPENNEFVNQTQFNYGTQNLENIKSPIDYSMSNLNSLMTKDKKIVAFLGSTKNGVSFLVNNLAEIFASVGIDTAILDMTRNRNSYYIYTQNEEALRQIAYTSMEKLQSGIAEGIKVKQNLTVYTALPNDGKEYVQAEPILSTLVQHHSLVLIDCDFNTAPSYFASSQEIYLVQSLDILTIQPLTAFLRDLKTQGVLEPEKVRVVINKELKVRGLSNKAIIGGMAFYNDPAMSFMTELFNKDVVTYCSIPFDENVYANYLEGILNCRVSLNGYSKNFTNKLRVLGDMVYPLTSRKTYSSNMKQSYVPNQSGFSNSMNDTLNKMKKNY